jgi:hypothetical protein
MEDAKTFLIRSNDYDYKKIINNYQLHDAIDKGKKKRFQSLVALNKRYKPTVEHMKELVIDRENKRVTQVKKELKDKEKKIRQNKEFLATSGNEILKIKKIRDQRERNALLQHDLVLESFEKKRLQEAERTESKLREFEENFYEKRKTRNNDYNEKLRKSYEEHERNLRVRDEKYEQLIKERDDKYFEKYTKAYWIKKNRQSQVKQKKNDHLKHLEQIKEMREEQERLYQKKLKKYQKKLNDMTKRKEQLEQKKKDDMEKFAQIQREKLDKVKENLNENKEQGNVEREAILDYQREYVVNRANNKDSAYELKRANARENVTLADMEMYRKMGQFNKDISQIQDKSMLKLSAEQRKEVYRNLLREEAEKKKKEEEDKKYAK